MPWLLTILLKVLATSKKKAFILALSKILKVSDLGAFFNYLLTEPEKIAQALKKLNNAELFKLNDLVQKELSNRGLTWGKQAPHATNPTAIAQPQPPIPINQPIPPKTSVTKPNTKPTLTKSGNLEELTDFKLTSSSWVKSGLYDKAKQTLTIMTNAGYGPYTYPGVPRAVWEIMKLQVGRNGTGAGQVFWDSYLKTIYFNINLMRKMILNKPTPKKRKKKVDK